MDRLGLLSVIGEAATASPDWAVKIAGQLNDSSYSSLKERAGVKRGFGLRFRGSRGVCRAC